MSPTIEATTSKIKKPENWSRLNATFQNCDQREREVP